MQTLWSPQATAHIPPRFRAIYTRLLPVIDLGVITFGVSALLLGSKIVAWFTIPAFLPIWAGLVIIGGVLALVGLVFLRPRLELAGRTGMIAGLLVYAGLTVLYIASGQPTAVLTLILVAIRIYASGWRYFDLLGQMVETRAAQVRKVDE